jgi:hypothetical protein
MVNNSLSARSVAFLPLVLMSVIHLFVTPLREIFKIEPVLMIIWYIIGISIGIVIYRKTFLVKDYEYRRSKVMQKMKKVYAAEEAGVWQSNAQIDSELSDVGKEKLSQNIGDINRESPEMEIDNEHKVEVEFLSESKHIVEATRRVSGKSTFDEQQIDSTIGATRKVNPMDKLLDWIGGLFGKEDIKKRRDERRQKALQAASSAAPVIVSRPNSPLQTTRRDTDSTLKATSMTDDGEKEITLESSYSASNDNLDNATKQYSLDEKAYSWDSNMKTTPSQSIESMAMLPVIESQPQNIINQSINSKSCRGCGSITPENERFCLNCGLDILP